MYKRLLITSIVVSCFCFSCGNGVVFNKIQPIQNKVWDKQAEYFFTFEINDNSVPYNVFLQLRNNDTYPYRNLWLFCGEQFGDSSIAVTDTIECMLADDFGKWKGNGITLFQSQFLLKNEYRFPETGQYTISVRQGMRDDKLKGIENIGLFIEIAR
ncbi:MAG: gliding motility lipoprotein GldH [Tannerella sp.]|nr:gliding motility lipoprotein GldH [Tannerella sp.]